MKSTPKEQYDARQKLRRIARGDDPTELTHEEVAFNVFYELANRFVTAIDGIEMNTRGSK